MNNLDNVELLHEDINNLNKLRVKFEKNVTQDINEIREILETEIVNIKKLSIVKINNEYFNETNLEDLFIKFFRDKFEFELLDKKYSVYKDTNAYRLNILKDEILISMTEETEKKLDEATESIDRVEKLFKIYNKFLYLLFGSISTSIIAVSIFIIIRYNLF